MHETYQQRVRCALCMNSPGRERFLRQCHSWLGTVYIDRQSDAVVVRPCVAPKRVERSKAVLVKYEGGVGRRELIN